MNAKAVKLSLIRHRMMALLFGIALMLPSLMQLQHILDGHKHLGCTQNSTHLHELDHGCDLLAFHFSPASLDLTEPEIQSHLIILKTSNFGLIDLFNNQLSSTQDSRGPPYLF